ncbi:MAG: TetR/AcrR family transcriptional regulator [Alphaproteobacteria bacterium]
MPKFVNHEEKRRELIIEAMNLVASEGYEATSMRRIAGAAGCTTGTLTHYFPDRASILIAMLRYVHEQATKRMQDCLDDEAAPKEQLTAVLREALPLRPESYREWRVWLAFWGAGNTNRKLVAEHQARYQEWHRLLEQLVTTVMSKQSGGNPKTVALHLIALVDGFGIQIAMTGGFENAIAKTLTRDCLSIMQNVIADSVSPGREFGAPGA